MKPEMQSVRDWLRVMLCGMGMGIADLVPGFSGGTVAFLTGIYPDLLNSIVSFNGRAFRALASLRVSTFFSLIAWEFLLALGMGIAVSAGTFVRVIHYVLGDPILRTYLFAAFVGLVVASATICGRQVREWLWPQVVGLGCGALTAFLVTSLPLGHTGEGHIYDVGLSEQLVVGDAHRVPLNNYDPKEQRVLAVPEATLVAMLSRGVVNADTPAYSHTLRQEGVVQDFVQGRSPTHFDLWLVFCGTVAISALLLPGMSGCYMLTILGAYPIFIGSLSDLVNGLLKASLDIDAAWNLVSLGVGVAIGLALFSRVVRWLLHHHRNVTVAAITGFMIGALRSVWPFWSYEYQIQPLRLQDGPQLQVVAPMLPDVTSGPFWIALACSVAGFAIVMLLDSMTKHRERLPSIRT